MAQRLAGRSDAFSQHHEPLRRHPSLQLAQSTVRGPFDALNPTQAYFRHVGTDRKTDVDNDLTGHGNVHSAVPTAAHAQYKWNSRNNRKGRHQLVIQPSHGDPNVNASLPTRTRDSRVIFHTIRRMLTDYPYWDISWLVAYIFTWGSIVWVINAFFVWLPLVKPSTEFKNEILTGGGITAFIGATIFELGSVFLMLEAINENRAGCFGWAIREAFTGSNRHMKITASIDECNHHHQNKKNLVGKGPSSASFQYTQSNGATPSKDAQKSWMWFPSWHDLRTHYLHEIGFLACAAQMFGATVFWISGFTALPGILNHLSPGLEDGIYWTPQVIGGTGFVVSGTLFMVETQTRWYKPALDVLGWHIGFWNLIGGVGFTLCPAFGYDKHSWAQYQASLSTFWGSCAFLIGSLIQLYESLQKHPVDQKKLPQPGTG